jgi:hypothetical protein
MSRITIKEDNPEGLCNLLNAFSTLRDELKTSFNLNSRLSFQLAFYPGGGARYTKHFDHMKVEV